MVTYSQYYHDSKPSKSIKLWDPIQVLEIINPDPGYNGITCSGYAPSQHRRCRKPINQQNRASILKTLDEIAYLQPNDPNILSRLQKIASLSLCVQFHRDQAGSILSKWQQRIKKMAPPRVEPRPTKSTRSFKQEPMDNQSFGDFMREYEAMKAELAQMKQERDECRRAPHSTVWNEEGSSRKREDEEKLQRRREKVEKKRREEERMEQERLERERQEEERLERERKEKERLEKEKKEREEKAKKAREYAQWTEGCRTRAQKKKAEAERAKREKELERQEWAQSWSRYQAHWTNFKNVPGEENLQRAIPWPVKSGLYRDVERSNVKEFFENTIMKGERVSTALRKECVKWHPDSRPRFPRGSELTQVHKEVIEVIVTTLTGMMDAVAKKSSECSN